MSNMDDYYRLHPEEKARLGRTWLSALGVNVRRGQVFTRWGRRLGPLAGAQIEVTGAFLPKVTITFPDGTRRESRSLAGAQRVREQAAEFRVLARLP